MRKRKRSALRRSSCEVEPICCGILSLSKSSLLAVEHSRTSRASMGAYKLNTLPLLWESAEQGPRPTRVPEICLTLLQPLPPSRLNTWDSRDSHRPIFIFHSSVIGRWNADEWRRLFSARHKVYYTSFGPDASRRRTVWRTVSPISSVRQRACF